MKSLNTFFQICAYLTIVMFIFTLCVHYVVGLDIFPVDVTQGLQPGETANESFNKTTVQPDYPMGLDMNTIWALIFTGAGIGGLLIAWFTHSTSVIGVFLFSVVFWASYINTLGILHIGAFIDPNFITIITGGMFFIFTGAIIGMLTGSG